MGTFYKTVQDRKKKKERKNVRGDFLHHLLLQQQKIMSKIANLRRYIGWESIKKIPILLFWRLKNVLFTMLKVKSSLNMLQIIVKVMYSM